jgi:PIN domain nuclease of toxin-antitoxin system
MRLLLDTHAFLWGIAESGGLSSTARKAMQDARNELLVSAVSFWEIATKFRIGKLPTARPVLQGADVIMRRLHATDLPVTREHALRAGSYPHEHGDLFDRMLVAQAEIEGLTLVSKDRVLRQFGVKLLW